MVKGAIVHKKIEKIAPFTTKGAVFEQLHKNTCLWAVFGESDQVRHKPGCTATEYGKRLEILDLGSNGVMLSM